MVLLAADEMNDDLQIDLAVVRVQPANTTITCIISRNSCTGTGTSTDNKL